MKFTTKLKHSSSLVDLTPLVDVVFLMLIFFIVTSDILPLKSLNIQNPTLNQASAPLTTQLIIVMDKDHVIYLGSKKNHCRSHQHRRAAKRRNDKTQKDSSRKRSDRSTER